jgi:hypothetical protein
MDPNKLNDLANRMIKGGKGAGIGLGFLAAAGGVAYGLYQSMYTGMTSFHLTMDCIICVSDCMTVIKRSLPFAKAIVVCLASMQHLHVFLKENF